MVGLSSRSGRSGGFGRGPRSRPRSYDGFVMDAATIEGLKLINRSLDFFMSNPEDSCYIVAHLFEECSKKIGRNGCNYYSEILSQYCQGWSGRGKFNPPKPISSEELNASHDAVMKNMGAKDCGNIAKLFEECASKFGSGDHHCTYFDTTWAQYCRDKVGAKKRA